MPCPAQAPICTLGPSRPRDIPAPIASTPPAIFATMTEAQPMDILPIRIPFTWGMPLPVHIGSRATILASIHAIATKAATYKRGKSHLPSPAASLIFSYTICLKSSEAPKR